MKTDSEMIENFINEKGFQCKPYNARVTAKQCEALRAKTVCNMTTFKNMRKQFEAKPESWGHLELYIQLYLGQTTCKNCDRFSADISRETQTKVNGIEKQKTSKFGR